jgi:hypothetical protein
MSPASIARISARSSEARLISLLRGRSELPGLWDGSCRLYIARPDFGFTASASRSAATANVGSRRGYPNMTEALAGARC